ncbi:hypothetical protein D9758_004085 [Tetrapyrgos nigripes]|uniref:Uncharacterized protein n=1 Tax=Tetrapyrgos nigripes TaxID=182062 RepID=A0A8H5GUP2_9AGAR|nr:hypothetical protein D9758_004085 [Tetrapyrgos nigripes]
MSPSSSSSTDTPLLNVKPSGLASGPVVFTNPFANVYQPAGAKIDPFLERKRISTEQNHWSQAEINHEIGVRMRIKTVVDLGDVEDVLQALEVSVADGVVDVNEAKSVLVDLRQSLSDTLERERRGDVDVLKRKFLQKDLPPSNAGQVDSSTSSSSSTHSSSNTSSEEERIHELPPDDCSISNLSFTDADASPKSIRSSPFQVDLCLNANGKTTSSSSKPQSWTVMIRAARKIFNRFAPARS